MAGVTDPRPSRRSGGPSPWGGPPSRLDVAIRLLGQIDSPESSRRLATLIDADRRGETSESAEREVRLLGLFIPALREDAAKLAAERQAYPSEQALAILRHRDPRDFLDELIDSLQAPVTVEVQRGSDRFSGTLRVESETLHFRRTYNPSFVRVQADTLVRIQAGTLRKNSRVVGHDINREYEQALDYQAAVDRKNRKVSGALRELTGRSVSDSDPVRAREDLKAWWADKRGYPYSPGEPRRKRTVDQVSPVTIYWSASRRLLRCGRSHVRPCSASGPHRVDPGRRPGARPGRHHRPPRLRAGRRVASQHAEAHAADRPRGRGVRRHGDPPVLESGAVAGRWPASSRSATRSAGLGGTARVVSIRGEEKVQSVFNLDVDRCRTYLVGASPAALALDNSLVDPVLHPFDAPGRAETVAAAGRPR